MSWGDYTFCRRDDGGVALSLGFGVWGLRERKTIGEATALLYGVDAQSKRLERVLHESHHGGGVPSDIDAQREG